LEIQEERLNNTKCKSLDDLEVSCRLNYANVKTKKNDFETSLSQAEQVLKIREDGRAYYRIG